MHNKQENVIIITGISKFGVQWKFPVSYATYHLNYIFNAMLEQKTKHLDLEEAKAAKSTVFFYDINVFLLLKVILCNVIY